MPWNDKSLRLQAARDRLHQSGKYQPTFKQSVALIIEILGLVHSPRNLSWCRRYAAKLRDQTSNPTPEQLALLGVLDDRLFKKAELIRARQERKEAAKAGRTKRQSQLKQAGLPAPIPASPPETITIGRENPQPGDPAFHSVLDEFER